MDVDAAVGQLTMSSHPKHWPILGPAAELLMCNSSVAVTGTIPSLDRTVFLSSRPSPRNEPYHCYLSWSQQ